MLWWLLCRVMSSLCFDTVLQTRCFPQIAFCRLFHLSFDFFKCFPYQHGATCQQCQKPFMIHLFSVKYGGALLHWAYESRPPSYFLISCMPSTLLFHHMVISCSWLKWDMWMLICHPPRCTWRTKSNLLSSCCCPEQWPHLDPTSLLFPWLWIFKTLS